MSLSVIPLQTCFWEKTSLPVHRDDSGIFWSFAVGFGLGQPRSFCHLLCPRSWASPDPCPSWRGHLRRWGICPLCPLPTPHCPGPHSGPAAPLRPSYPSVLRSALLPTLPLSGLHPRILHLMDLHSVSNTGSSILPSWLTEPGNPPAAAFTVASRHHAVRGPLMSTHTGQTPY